MEDSKILDDGEEIILRLRKLNILLDKILKECKENEKELTICVHPFIEAYLNRGFMSSLSGKWRSKYKKKIKVQAEPSHQFLEVKYLNAKNEQIKT